MSRKTQRNAIRKATRASLAAANQATYARLRLSGFTLGSMAFGSSLFAAEPADAPATTSKSSEPRAAGSGDHGYPGLPTAVHDIKQQAVGCGRSLRRGHRSISRRFDRRSALAHPRCHGKPRLDQQHVRGGAPTATGATTGITVRGFGTQFNEILTEVGKLLRAMARTSTSPPWAPNTSASSTSQDARLRPLGGAVGATINIKIPAAIR